MLLPLTAAVEYLPISFPVVWIYTASCFVLELKPFGLVKLVFLVVVEYDKLPEAITVLLSKCILYEISSVVSVVV